ncbi:hypothetical protein Salat_1971200 [Sesamum alatum]|uniref:Uncharacterized protein n=1 Tax=Sesamum alatum TaxID=300844 RepID=A0AAE1Y698_9LAMI|nr:hypothetical protein Salat_1971200 [Sesamum alatum]
MAKRLDIVVYRLNQCLVSGHMCPRIRPCSATINVYQGPCLAQSMSTMDHGSTMCWLNQCPPQDPGSGMSWLNYVTWLVAFQEFLSEARANEEGIDGGGLHIERGGGGLNQC